MRLLHAHCFAAGSNYQHLDNSSGRVGLDSAKEVNLLDSAKETGFGLLDSANKTVQTYSSLDLDWTCSN